MGSQRNRFAVWGKHRSQVRSDPLLVAAGAIIAGYVFFAAMLYLWRGTYFAPDPPDSWAALLLVVAIALGQWRRFLRDWIPFVALLFGYEVLRGFTGTVVTGEGLTPSSHGAVRWHFLLVFDQWIAGGTPLTLRLQQALYRPGRVMWYDIVAGFIYSLHFALPLLFGFLLWYRNPPRFRQFTVTLLAMTYATFVVFLLVPTAPPWLLGLWGKLPGVADPLATTVNAALPQRFAHFDALTIWTKASPDPVAAFPSLHAAYPWLIFLCSLQVFGKRGWFLLLYNGLVWFSVVYLGQHWIADVLAGIAWATAAFVIVTTFAARPHGRQVEHGTASSALAPIRHRQALPPGDD
jgi:membrane-associated phospholipid phosphatase